MAAPGTDARRGAVALLSAVLTDRRILSDSLGLLDRFAPADRAAAQRLATETLRLLGKADRVLAKFLSRRPPPFVLNALRLGTMELCLGAPAHGVVSDLVAVVGGHRKHQALKGLTNAVLRQVATDGPQIWTALGPPRLPKGLRQRLVRAWGAKAVAKMEAVQAMRPPLDLTPKSPDLAEGVAQSLSGVQLPTGSVRLEAASQVSALPGFQEGDWWVQDAAAAVPVAILDARPGEPVLDMCAAPGGKTMQLAAAGARVTALDPSEPRMARLRANLDRTGLDARLIVGDAQDHTEIYAAILLDAPCSASGTIRRHPDLPHIKSGKDFDALVPLQAALLDHAWACLAPGGRLVYCTCSLFPEEGEAQIATALARLPGAKLDQEALKRPGIDPDWICDAGGLRLRPDLWADQGGMDGFYIAALRKSD